MLPKKLRPYLYLLAGLLGISLGLYGIVAMTAEAWWFEQLGYANVFWQRLQTQLGLGGLVFALSVLLLGGNIWLAQRWRHPPHPPVAASRALPPRLVSCWPNLWQGELNLAWLLLLLILGTGLLLVLCGSTLWPSARVSVWVLGGLAILGAWLWRNPVQISYAIGLSLSLSLGWQASQQWQNLLQFGAATAFGQTDPVFKQDLAFYIFQLPLIEQLQHWLILLFGASALMVTLIYLLSGHSLSQGFTIGWSRRQQQHFSGLAVVGLLILATWHGVGSLRVLYHPRETFFGAGFTDIVATIPLQFALAAVSLGLGISCLLSLRYRKHWRKLFRLCAILYVSLWGFGLIITSGIQTLVVLPNELQRETQAIQWGIQATRQAFGLDQIDTEDFQPRTNLQAADLKANNLTVRNIRLWDSRPLLETNRQLQQLRPYYRFPSAFIDRYRLKTDLTQPNPEQRQVFVAAREMDTTALPKSAQTWVNQHLVYSHGYGFTMSPVNTAGTEGLPEYFVKDIGGDQQGGQLLTTNPGIAASLPLDTPRLYFGQATTNHIFAPTQVQELDYPTGTENAYNHYDGQGGVLLNSAWRRGVIAAYLQDWQLLFSRSFTPQTQVLWRRQIEARVKAIAPFLKLDQQPYLVVADLAATPLDASKPKLNSHLYWVIDAYSTSTNYPYSDADKDGLNYIRNSVKVVVDAYLGTVKFYTADPADPILQTWHKVFPGLFQPFEQMPRVLQEHLRYPVDLFKIQSQRLLRYHVTDPVVFYNQEDQWQIPTEIYGSKPQQVTPYYLILKLPRENQAEFVLLSPFTPLSRPNLIAWLAARSDGVNYGKLLLYQFPKQELIFGPEQLEARINQDPKISAQITLWNRSGSRVLQGNLLVIPINQSLLYVEPLYLQAEQNSLPTLARVVVMYNSKIVMDETLDKSLAQAFSSP